MKKIRLNALIKIIIQQQPKLNKTKFIRDKKPSEEINTRLKEIITIKVIIKEIQMQQGTVLFVVQDEDNKKYIEKESKKKEKNVIVITDKWIGGLLTNWNQYQDYFQSKIIQKIEKNQKALKIDRALKVFYKKEKPSLVVLMSTKKENLLTKECKKENIPLIELTKEKLEHQQNEKHTYWIKTNNNIKVQYIIKYLISKALMKYEKI